MMPGWAFLDLMDPGYWMEIVAGALLASVTAYVVAWGRPRGLLGWFYRAAWLYAAGGAVGTISMAMWWMTLQAYFGLHAVLDWPWLWAPAGYFGPLALAIGCVHGWIPTAGGAHLRRLGWIVAAVAGAIAVLPAFLIGELYFPYGETRIACAFSFAALNGYCYGVAFRLFTEGDPILLPSTLPPVGEGSRQEGDH